ncbi:MAG: hypothetical protein ABIF28_04530 [Pseudomonadota bacterium]
MSAFAAQLSALASACVPLQEWVAEQLAQAALTITELRNVCPRAGVSFEEIRTAAESLVKEQRAVSTLDEAEKCWRYSLAAVAVARRAETPGYPTPAHLRDAVLNHIRTAATPPTAAQVARALDAPVAQVSASISYLKNRLRAIQKLPATKGTHFRYVATQVPPLLPDELNSAQPAETTPAPAVFKSARPVAEIEVAPPGLVSITAFGITEHLSTHESISVIEALNATLQKLLLTRATSADHRSTTQ